MLVDDAQELDLAAATLVRELAGDGLTSTAIRCRSRRFRGAGAERLRSFAGEHGRAERSLRVPASVVLDAAAARAVDGVVARLGAPGGKVEFWRCANDRAQAQAVAADIERLVATEGVPPGQILVIVPAIAREGQAVAVALEERAVPHRLVGEAAFFQRAEIRDVLAWLRLLADPSDAPAVVRALARPPIELRSVDIARCTQIARRRKLDMVAALAAATESPQVPPEARERIRVFLKLYRAASQRSTRRAPISTCTG